MAILYGNDRNQPNDTDLAAGTPRGPAADFGKTYPSVPDVGHPYQLIKSLGGTPGDVLYLARHRETGALLDVREFTGDRGADGDLVGSLRHLAARAARVAHQCPGIATLSECERTGGVGLALAMAHHDGATLRETIQRTGGLDPQRAIAIAVKIAEALQRAHACGLVHGGLRPDNVLLVGPEPTVLLTQYGIDRILARWTALRRRKGTSVKTGSVYEAPEQVHGEMTERGDVYTFGVILYEMLAGSFPRAGIESIRRGHLERLVRRRPGIAPGVQRVISRTLQLKPERRPEVAALCDDLRAEIGGAAPPTAPRRRAVAGGWTRTRRASLVAGGFIVAAGLAIWAAEEYLVPPDARWALPWSRLAPDPSRAQTAPTPAAPVASPSSPTGPPDDAGPPAAVNPPAVASQAAVVSPRVEAPSAPQPAGAPAAPASLAPASPAPTSAAPASAAPASPAPAPAARGEASAPPPAPAPARPRPRPSAPRVDARHEPPSTRPAEAAPPASPSNPSTPEPARTPRQTGEDPSAVIDWLLNEGRQHR
jgi:serine/threonine-protein kinase